MRSAKAIRNNLDSNRHGHVLGRTIITLLGGSGGAFHVGFLEINKLKNKLRALVVGGTTLAILCRFTTLIPIFLTAVGLTGMLVITSNDAVLLPVLAGFLILTGYAMWLQKKQK